MLLSGSWLRLDRGRGAAVIAGRDRCFPSQDATPHQLESGLGLLPCLGPNILAYRFNHVNDLSCLGPHFARTVAKADRGYRRAESSTAA